MTTKTDLVNDLRKLAKALKKSKCLVVGCSTTMNIHPNGGESVIDSEHRQQVFEDILENLSYRQSGTTTWLVGHMPGSQLEVTLFGVKLPREKA